MLQKIGQRDPRDQTSRYQIRDVLNVCKDGVQLARISSSLQRRRVLLELRRLDEIERTLERIRSPLSTE